MTRSASPNGQVEFSYDFPVASTSQLPPTPSRTTHKRPRSPQRPRWESSQNYYAADDDDDEALGLDDEIDYDAFGYPYPASIATRTRRAHTHPAPTPTRNQWRAPSPPLYPFGQTTGSAYPYSAPLLLAPPAPHHAQVASSCESTCSMLSACSRASKEKKDAAHHHHAKIRKPRRSVDSDAPPSLAPPSAFSSPASSPASSPYLSTYGDDFDADEDEQDRRSAHSADDDDDEEQEEKQQQQQHEGHAPSSLRRQWAALSLRVRFGVFRAKRRMRNRVMSL